MARAYTHPKIKIDLETVGKLAELQCTDLEIATFLRLSQDTITRRKRDNPAFVEALESGKGRGKISLRRLQWLSAQGERGETITTVENGKTIVTEKRGREPSIAMQIWLGKQVLGQTEKQEVFGKETGPIVIKVEHVNSVRNGNGNSA